MLNEPGPRTVVKAAGRAIEAVSDPSKTPPLALRFIDAASWHGQAVRETSAAASIVKSVTALKRLVTVDKERYRNLYDQDGLFDRPQTKRQLTDGLEYLVTWSKDADARRWGSRNE